MVNLVASGGQGGRVFGAFDSIVVINVDDKLSVDVDEGVESISVGENPFVLVSCTSSDVFKSNISTVGVVENSKLDDVVGTVWVIVDV